MLSKECEIQRMSKSTQTSTVDVLGISIRIDFAMRDVVRDLVDRAEKNIRTDVAFVHTDCINIAQRDRDYAEVLERQDYVLPDGAGVKLGAMFKRSKPKENINGTDMFPLLCQQASEFDHGMFFLGSKPGVAERMCAKLLSKYPNFRIAGMQDGYFQPEELNNIIATINSSGARFLLVGLGSPVQEKWLHDHGDLIKVPIRMGVGGLFDFYSGDIPRAPMWMRKNSLEWLFRLIIQPRLRFKRYVVGIPVFIFRLIVDRLKIN